MSCKWASASLPAWRWADRLFCGLSPAAWQGCAPARAAHPARGRLAQHDLVAPLLLAMVQRCICAVHCIQQVFTGAHGGHADGHGHMQHFA